MSDEARALKTRLPRTWPSFFAQHGLFTTAQRAAIPLILDGADVVVCAPTASGKTEAALAPLIERHLPPAVPPALTVLYLTPTRALVNDLYQRLRDPLADMRLRVAIRTGDRDTFDARKADPHILITTPESFDSLLTSRPQAFSHVRAVVIDELHVLDGTSRGDQLRVLILRLRWIRNYAHQTGDAPDSTLQGVMLSATLSRPDAVGARYFPAAQAVIVEGGRALNAEFLALTDASTAPLIEHLNLARQRGWRKVLAFCSTRAEVEGYAATVRQARQPFGEAVYVHYSNLSTQRRLEVEDGFGNAEVALCFASSTLELGIDIGTIDHVIVIGAPPDYPALMQRIGRGRRRATQVNVTCVYRSPLERVVFEALLAQVGVPDRPLTPFRPSVAVQQIFSLIKQSPQAMVRVALLIRLLSEFVSETTVREILGELQANRWLIYPRTDEFTPGPRLIRMIDRQGMPTTTLSLHSNIQMSEGVRLEIRDQATGASLAHVGGEAFVDGVLTLGGRTMNIEWTDGVVMMVSASLESSPLAKPAYLRGTRPIFPAETAASVMRYLGFQAGDAPFVQRRDGRWFWLHGLGDVYGEALFELLKTRWSLHRCDMLWLALELTAPPADIGLPTLSDAEVNTCVRRNHALFERLLSMGAYHALLPQPMAIQAVCAAFDTPRFLSLVGGLRLFTADILNDDEHHALSSMPLL